MSITAFLKKLTPNAMGEALRAATFVETDVRLDGWTIRKDAQRLSKPDLLKLVKPLYGDKTDEELKFITTDVKGFLRGSGNADIKGYTYTEGDAQIYVLWNIKHYDNDQSLCFFVSQAGRWIICIGTDYSQATDLWYHKIEFE